MIPQTSFHPLTRADGSATYADQLFTILAGVNGPVEVQRRDELPETAAIEVNVRPLAGIGSPRERWLEDVVQSLLKSIILIHMYPRTLIQVTLQITKEPDIKFDKGKGDVALLPSLMNASFLALIDAGLPLRTTAISTLFATSGNEIVNDPSKEQVQKCTGIHALAYDLDGNLLFDESTGRFGIELWEEIVTKGRQRCLAAIEKESDDVMAGTDTISGAWFRQTLQDKVRDLSGMSAV